MANNEWSIESFCSRQLAVDESSLLHQNSLFLQRLGLSFVHPVCQANQTYYDTSNADVPPMGPSSISFLDLHQGSRLESLVTHGYYMIVPALLSLCALWLLLFAAIIAPVGCMLLTRAAFRQDSLASTGDRNVSTPSTILMLLTLSSSMVIMLDQLYIHDFGSSYGTTLVALSLILSLRCCKRHVAVMVRGCLVALSLMALGLSLIANNSSHGPANIDEGLYYDNSNPMIQRVVSLWNHSSRTYSPQTGATPWMVTGDVRTGLPFFLNDVGYKPNWTRVWLPTTTSSDAEILALDISFPAMGHSMSKPVYLVFHGLNGGSNEGYVLDLVKRRNLDGSTVVVLIARGMMDTPIRSWSLFHGARTCDAHDASQALRRALHHNQLLVGVGYSMGAIVLNNYVAEAGSACALDAAFTISGALDARYELKDDRSKRLWQPILADSMKTRFLLNKHGKKVQARLSNHSMVSLMRATSVVDVDKVAATAYHGFDTVEAYYEAMSALGDIPQEDYHKNISITAIASGKKISNVSIPLCVLHAFEDPISTWKTIISPEGFMRPDRLVKTGKGNLMLLLTKRGGHVGWPLGWLSHIRTWEFMNGAAADFVNAIAMAKREQQSAVCLSEATTLEESQKPL